MATRIAERAGVSIPTAVRWVRGKAVLPASWEKLRAAAEGMGYVVEVKEGG